MYDLQNRWKQEGNVLKYYGLKNKQEMFKNIVKLNKKQLEIMKKLPCELSGEEIKILKNLFGNQVVDIADKKVTSKSFEEALFCKRCVANDFMIPGLEFDESGLCQ